MSAGLVASESFGMVIDRPETSSLLLRLKMISNERAQRSKANGEVRSSVFFQCIHTVRAVVATPQS